MTTLLEKPICDRHCTVCEGMDHHWLPDFDDEGEPIMACKHCAVTRPAYIDSNDDKGNALSDEEAALDECGLGSDGQCAFAGSEWCDWECPMRDSEFFAGSKAWKAKHRKPRSAKIVSLFEDKQ